MFACSAPSLPLAEIASWARVSQVVRGSPDPAQVPDRRSPITPLPPDSLLPALRSQLCVMGTGKKDQP